MNLTVFNVGQQTGGNINFLRKWKKLSELNACPRFLPRGNYAFRKGSPNNLHQSWWFKEVENGVKKLVASGSWRTEFLKGGIYIEKNLYKSPESLLNSRLCKWDYKPCKAWNIYYSAVYSKSFLIFALEVKIKYLTWNFHCMKLTTE